ncbi:hypothetical protein ACA910_015939 [Epithemia clementina (nom. ined.)]
MQLFQRAFLALSWCSFSFATSLVYSGADRGGASEDSLFFSLDHLEASARLLQSCGGYGEACCISESGTPHCDDRNKYSCNSTNQCDYCGGSNELCCYTVYGQTCDSESNYCNTATNTCQSCGYDSNPCCPQADGSLGCRNPVNTACDLTASPPTCKYCGSTGSICCDAFTQSNQCDSEYAVCDSTSNTCVSCGGTNEACCPDEQGNGYCENSIARRCVSGICEECGDEGEACCTGAGNRQCNSAHLFCNAAETCATCGDNDEPCCPGSGSTAPGSGICRDTNYRTCIADGNGGGVCKTCGGSGETCCEGGTCDSYFSFCNGQGICQECGAVGGPCCAGNWCNNEGYTTCNVNHANGPTCESCGWNGQIPCRGSGSIAQCKSEFSIVKNGLCQSCGGSNQVCCESANPCRYHSVRTCVPNGNGGGTCQNCGGSGQPCCNSAAGPTCDIASLTCQSGTCVSTA